MKIDNILKSIGIKTAHNAISKKVKEFLVKEAFYRDIPEYRELRIEIKIDEDEQMHLYLYHINEFIREIQIGEI